MDAQGLNWIQVAGKWKQWESYWRMRTENHVLVKRMFTDALKIDLPLRALVEKIVHRVEI